MNNQEFNPGLVKLTAVGLAFYLSGIFFSIVFLQIGIVILFVGSLPLLMNRLKTRPFTHFEILIILYFLSALLAVFFSKNPPAAFTKLMKYLALWALIPLLILSGKIVFSSPRKLAQILIIGGTICAVAGFYYHFYVGLERTQAFNGRYFTLAGLLILTLPISLGYFLDSAKERFRWLVILSAGLQLAALWWTYTRSAFLALVIGLSATAVLFLFRNTQTLSRAKIGRAFLFALPVLLIIGLIWQSPDPRINPFKKELPASIPRGTTRIDLSSGRSQIYRDALHILSKDWQEKRWVNLLLGHGLKSRTELFQSSYRSWESDYLQALLNQGIVGLVILLGIYFIFLKNLAFLVAFLLHGAHSPGLGGGFFAAGLSYWIMSFFTLQISNIYGCAYFVVLVLAIIQLNQTSRPETVSGQPNGG